MMWLRNRKLSFKLGVAIGLVLLLAFGSLIGVNLKQIYSSSLSQGESQAKEASSAVSNDFQKQVDETVASLSTLRSVVLEASTSKSLTREEVVRILNAELVEHKKMLAFYTLWEPNAFDKKDAANIKKLPYDDSTGRFIPYVVRVDDKIDVQPLLDYEKEGAGDYYLIAKKTKKNTWIEPYLYPISGKDVLITSLILPILDKQGNFLGIVGADMALSDMQKQIEQLKPLGGYASMVSAAGSYVANGTSPEKVSKPYSENPETAAIWEGVQKGERSAYMKGSNGEDLHLFTPIQLDGSDHAWYMESVISKQTILQAFNEGLTLSLIIAISALIILAVIMFLIVRMFVLSPIQAVSRLSVKLAEGEFTEKLTVKGRDEFGLMSEQFNTMVDKLRMMIHTVTEHAMSVGATSEQLNASAEQTSRAAETIAISIQEMASGSETQLIDAQETARAMTEMAIGVQKIAESTAIVTDSTEDVRVKTTAGNDNIQMAVRQMGFLKEKVEETSIVVRRLGERSEAIGSIIGVISGISKQTNLLALNAAIEASRAGEHGRGFAVVAAEVRKLAEQSNAASHQIAELISEISEDTKLAVKSMDQGTTEVTKGVQVVTESGEIFASITVDMTQVHQQIQEVSAASEQMSASTEQVLATVEQLASIARSSTHNAQNVAAASEEQLATMEEISASSEALGHLVQELVDLLARFKV
ncbi:methyl-accepting chemotaxis protein [Paenibacillus sp. HWE-109]|uniref:methyl-accepting chemotaxis protein n=1 Tax=Paenibacillus sp. HWE-109 TaxID=1306526 RepID=UPI001EDE6267|nr:methyl-accepting chemotaxis protein [Paenibacillus sp. HWE-109]UKS24167.1 methyl-accepting chemotaxis protein [Paenibacillus sp. HWE-109]